MEAVNLLTDKGLDYELSGKDAVIKCLNPEHDDSNPSMRVDKVTGMFHCFSCGYKGNLFTYFGAPQSPLEIKRYMLKEKIAEKKASAVGIKMPSGAVMYNGTLRNISADTLKIWSAFTWDDGDKFAGRVIFPIRDITGKTVGLIGRLLRDDPTRPKYHLYPPGLRLPLCPAKPKMIQNRIILVEGIFDALNLWDKGLKNAVCCFGTQSVDWVKLSILKMQGATGVDIMFDGDEAGQIAATKVEGICDTLGLAHQTIKLKQGNDPGNFTQKGIDTLKRRLYG